MKRLLKSLPIEPPGIQIQKKLASKYNTYERQGMRKLPRIVKQLKKDHRKIVRLLAGGAAYKQSNSLLETNALTCKGICQISLQLKLRSLLLIIITHLIFFLYIILFTCLIAINLVVVLILFKVKFGQIPWVRRTFIWDQSSGPYSTHKLKSCLVPMIPHYPNRNRRIRAHLVYFHKILLARK